MATDLIKKIFDLENTHVKPLAACRNKCHDGDNVVSASDTVGM